MARIALKGGEVLEVAGVGQGVQVYDGVVRLRQPVKDKVTSDKAGATGDENHNLCPSEFPQSNFITDLVTLPIPNA